MKSYWTAVGLFNKGSFTKALEKLTAIPETDPLSLYGFQLKAQLARQLQDRQLLLETLSRLGQAESPAVSRPARLLLADVLVNQECYQNAAAILEQLKTEDGTDSNRLIRSYAELIEGKLAGKQGNLDQAIKTFSAVMDNKSYPEKIRDLGRLALAKAEIAREKAIRNRRKRKRGPSLRKRKLRTPPERRRNVCWRSLAAKRNPPC